MKDMMQRTFSRIVSYKKSMLVATGLLVITLLTPALVTPELRADRSYHRYPPTLTGTWRTEVENPPPGFISYETFTEAVGSLEISHGPAGPTTGIGTWQRIGARDYLATFYKQQFGPGGNLVATIKVRRLITISSNGNELTGTANVDIYDPAAHLVASPITSANGAFRATRVAAEPLTF